MNDLGVYKKAAKSSYYSSNSFYKNSSVLYVVASIHSSDIVSVKFSFSF